MKIILWIIKKFLTPERIAQLLAGIIANLLRKASQTDNWDLYKGIIQKTETLCRIFNRVYDDDNLTKDEEEAIAKEIEKLVEAESLKKILGKVDPML